MCNCVLNMSFSIGVNFSLRSNELVITPIELKPMSAPAREGESMVPVTGSNVPAATGIPTCKDKQKEIESMSL